LIRAVPHDRTRSLEQIRDRFAHPDRRNFANSPAGELRVRGRDGGREMEISSFAPPHLRGFHSVDVNPRGGIAFLHRRLPIADWRRSDRCTRARMRTRTLQTVSVEMSI